jgi:3-hydroxypropanoate dehydrogenase
MGGFDRDGVDREFFPDGAWRSLVVINIGLPAADGYRERLPRLELADVSRVV